MQPRYDPRVFLALRFSRTTQERLLAVQDDLRQHLHNWHFISPENFHLTLRFFGEVPEEQITRIHEVCNALSPSLHPFAMRLNHVDYFGTPHSARVLYAGGEHCAGLSKLVDAVQHEFPDQRDKRTEFRPHVTLAKARAKMERTIEVLNSVALRRLREQGKIGKDVITIDSPTVHREFVLMETNWVGRSVEYS
ncbi:MAG: RNA 2',3'-cyclic phosphodiesterase, partial [bacterium]|nr:RNA 2',3'-cyclic phosphodiesterase [bacterium]